jgi:response regulator RpfG family c-di-GMP phosphodiesterase
VQVLIVDDEPSMRRLLGLWAESEGAAVVEAPSAEQAIVALDCGCVPAVAFCDLRLPGKDGLWLAEQLRQRSPDTAVVMTTGVHEFDAAVSSLQAGVVDYVAKPFVRERIASALQRAFTVHTSRSALTRMQRELETRRAQIAEALAELETNVATSLTAMTEMLRARDPHACDHSRRVARIAVDLAMALQIGEPQLSDIERAALLHNLGRLALPDDLLRRPESRLSHAERVRLHAHPLHGYAMLRHVPFLTAANAIAVAAHERYDGTGFPHGLAGEAIPLGARIIAAADAYDELVAGDPPHAPEQAVAVLVNTRRSAFDPQVLNALTMLHPARTSA